MQHLFQLNNLQLLVNLGWSAAERQLKQTVSIDIIFQLQTFPDACTTDLLTGTVCYDSLIQHLEKNIISREFHLLETLTAEIFQIIKKYLPADSSLRVTVTKMPGIKKLVGGVSFSCGNLPCIPSL